MEAEPRSGDIVGGSRCPRAKGGPRFERECTFENGGAEFTSVSGLYVAAPRLGSLFHIHSVPSADALGYGDVAAPRLSHPVSFPQSRRSATSLARDDEAHWIRVWHPSTPNPTRTSRFLYHAHPTAGRSEAPNGFPPGGSP